MMPDKKQLQQIMDYFGIKGSVDSFGVLANMQEERNGKKAIRMAIEVHTGQNRAFIVRFLNEREFIMDVSHLCISTQTLENQSKFSEMLREQGMLVPKKYSHEGMYCLQMVVDGMDVDVTVEDYLGKPLKIFSKELFKTYGELLGKMHRISLDKKMHIGFSIVYTEVMENRTNYKKLFSGTRTEALDGELLEKIEKLHDRKKEKIFQIWPVLPRAAVQGDIYSCNNVAVLPEGIGFYDFNIAADEVLLGDFLHLWFRTIYDIENEDLRKDWDMDICWKEYVSGYQKYREFTKTEQENFSLVYGLLGSIYITKYVAELLRRERIADAQENIKTVWEILSSDEERVRL